MREARYLTRYFFSPAPAGEGRKAIVSLQTIMMEKQSNKEFASRHTKFIVVCPCGMTSEFRRLVHLDEHKRYTESANFRYYLCDDCGRLIDRTSLEVIATDPSL